MFVLHLTTTSVVAKYNVPIMIYVKLATYFHLVTRSGMHRVYLHSPILDHSVMLSYRGKLDNIFKTKVCFETLITVAAPSKA
jgi:hypothetical protein